MPSSLHIDSNPGWGGGQAQSLGLALALAARGEEIWFIAQPGSELASRLSSTYLSWQAVPLRGIRGTLSLPRLVKMMREISPDIIHIHESASHVAAGLAARMAVRSLPLADQREARGGAVGGGRPKIIVTRRTELPLRGGRLGQTKYHLWCDKLICVSEAVRSRCRQAGLPEALLTVIPDFVDCRYFDPSVGQGLVYPERSRGAPATPGPGRTIVAIGRLTATNGRRLLLRSLQQVVKQAPGARLLICGAGGEEQALRAQAQRLGLAAHVTFAGFANDARDALAQADVFVMPSPAEGSGVAVLEAMAMEKPVVATDAGGLVESVVHGETGLIVPAGDPTPLARALIELLGDPARARSMGRAGRQRALAHFDRPRIVERLLAVYDELVAGSRCTACTENSHRKGAKSAKI